VNRGVARRLSVAPEQRHLSEMRRLNVQELRRDGSDLRKILFFKP